MATKLDYQYKHIFGPIPSRRLGTSLGLDLLPHKTCTLDCVYCECGKTTQLTVERDEYVSIRTIQEELKRFLFKGPVLDYITFSGSGEPTLHIGLVEMVQFLKTQYPQYKLALLTNGTLFYRSDVRAAAKDVDLIIASLDAVSGDLFDKINRPHERLNAMEMLDGLISLRKQFINQLWLEIFLVPGMNTADRELQGLREAIQKINPDKVQLNSLDRPGTERWVEPVTKEYLSAISEKLLSADLIRENQSNPYDSPDYASLMGHLLSTIRRRPCTCHDLSKIFGMNPSEVDPYIRDLIEQGEIKKIKMPRGCFYTKKESS